MNNIFGQFLSKANRASINNLINNKYLTSQYSHIIENISMAICYVTLDGHFLDVNTKFLEISGYEKNELLSMCFSEIIHHEELEKSEGQVNNAKNKHDCEPFEIRFVHKNGSLIFASTTISALSNKNGQDSFLIITINDITKIRKIEQELSEKERILNELQKIAQIGSFEGDLILGIWRASDQINDIFGIKKGYPNNFRGFAKLIQQASRKEMVEYFKFIIQNKKKFDCEYKIIRPNDKQLKWVHIIGELVLSSAGTPLKLIGTVQDITERKALDEALIESEARSKSMLANVADVIAIIDKEGTITYISPNCTNVFSMFPESIIGTKAWSTIYSEDVERMKSEMASLVESKAIKKVVEYRHQHSNGRISEIELTAINMVDDPNINGILVTYHNITDKKIWEREIIYLNHHDTLTGLYNRFFFDEETRRLDKKRQLPISIIMGDINGLKLINDAFGHSEGDNLLVNVANILKGSLRAEDILARVGGDEFAVILPKTSEETVEKIVDAMYNNCKDNRKKGVTELDFTSISLGAATKKTIDKSIELVREEAEIAMYKRKLLESKSIHSSIMATIKTSMLEKSHNTQEHAERLINLSASVGKELGLNSSQLNDLELLATLHDLGKMGIDKELLDKPSTLNNEEKAEMKRHPEIGYRIAKSSPDLIQLSDMILAHHEYWDGTGYPQGLKGENIPLLSRIISIVDAYDAMTSDRAYRKAITKKEAIAEINRCKGIQFDPTIADIFINILSLES